jgi:hypothetical protein
MNPVMMLVIFSSFSAVLKWITVLGLFFHPSFCSPSLFATALQKTEKLAYKKYTENDCICVVLYMEVVLYSD